MQGALSPRILALHCLDDNDSGGDFDVILRPIKMMKMMIKGVELWPEEFRRMVFIEFMVFLCECALIRYISPTYLSLPPFLPN